MTSISFCQKCNSHRFNFDEDTNEVETQGEMGVKSSCCGKCSNLNCVDYGECTCFETRMKQRLDDIMKMVQDGSLPILNND